MPHLKLLLISLLPMIFPGASSPGHKHSRSSHHTEIVLEEISYSSALVYSTPAHLAVAYAKLAFNLTNTAVPYTTLCTASSSQEFDFFYGEVIYRCYTPGVHPGASASFTFNQPDGTFHVNQTWIGESPLKMKQVMLDDMCGMILTFVHPAM
jgi:hypothetical protein